MQVYFTVNLGSKFRDSDFTANVTACRSFLLLTDLKLLVSCTTGSPNSSCEMIILCNSGHGENRRVRNIRE